MLYSPLLQKIAAPLEIMDIWKEIIIITYSNYWISKATVLGTADSKYIVN